jgi:nicotinamidase-related amidase
MKVLLVIDVQRGFINCNTAHVVPKIRTLLDMRHFQKHLFTRFINSPNSQFAKQLQLFGMYEDDPDTELAPELIPYASEVFIKYGYGSLTPELHQLLTVQQASQVVLVGIETDACVLKTAFDLFDAGFHVQVISDLCASGDADPRIHESALSILARNIGVSNVLTLEELLRR